MLMALVTGGSNRDTEVLSETVIAEQIIPENPGMLYEFAMEYVPADSPARSNVLKRAAEILAAEAHSRREFTLLMGDIQLALGNLEDSIEEYRLALISQPNDPKTRYKRAKLLFQTDRIEEAFEEAGYLRRHDSQNSTYNKFLDDVKSEMEKRARD